MSCFQSFLLGNQRAKGCGRCRAARWVGGWVGGWGEHPAGGRAAQGVSAWRGCLLTNARPAIRVEGVLLVAATRGARVRVLTAVLAASVSIVTGY